MLAVFSPFFRCLLEYILRKPAGDPSFGFTIFGGNCIGIFVDHVDPSSPAGRQELPKSARIVTVMLFYEYFIYLTSSLPLNPFQFCLSCHENLKFERNYSHLSCIVSKISLLKHNFNQIML